MSDGAQVVAGPPGTALTVSARVVADDGRAEALQALVSRWRPPDEWPGFAAIDAGSTGGLPSRGYFGAVCDGRYVYFVPRQIDLTRYHSHLLRYDTAGTFEDGASWSAFDMGEAHSKQGAAFDGRFIYFCPGFSGDPRQEDEPCGRVLRFDTQGEFRCPSSYASVDITAFLGPRSACFDGGAFDGRYAYFVPLDSGLAVRCDTTKPFGDPASWEAFDGRPLGFRMAVGAVFDGTFLYYCAYGHGRILRYDTRGGFDDPAAWSAHDADPTGGLRTTGFDGGFFDGRFVYFQPFFRHVGPEKRDNLFHSFYLRHDVTGPFEDPSSWQSRDASATDGLRSVGYNGGAFDGRFFYAAP